MSIKFALLFALVFVACVSAEEEGYAAASPPAASPPAPSGSAPPASTPSAPSTGQQPGLNPGQLQVPLSAIQNILEMIGLGTVVQSLMGSLGPAMMGDGIGRLTSSLMPMANNAVPNSY